MALESGMNMSPADIRAVVGDEGFGGSNGAWWIIILFLLCGWGRGYGGYGNDGSGAANNYVLASDFATLQRQISDGFGSVERKGDSISNGLCDGFYAQNTTMLNGFAGVNQNLANGFANAELARTNGQTALMQEVNGVSRQIADCCCQSRYDALQQSNATQGAIKDGFCQTNYNNATNTRDIIEAGNANTKAILDMLTAQAIEAKDARIAEMNQQLFAYQLQSSQAMQTNQIINTLHPAPIPAFSVPNPYTYSGCGCNGCGC